METNILYARTVSYSLAYIYLSLLHGWGEGCLNIAKYAIRHVLFQAARKSHLDRVWKMYPLIIRHNNSLQGIIRPRYHHCLHRIAAYWNRLVLLTGHDYWFSPYVADVETRYLISGWWSYSNDRRGTAAADLVKKQRDLRAIRIILSMFLHLQFWSFSRGYFPEWLTFSYFLCHT